jgi:hypothetical protein
MTSVGQGREKKWQSRKNVRGGSIKQWSFREIVMTEA